MLFHNTLFVLVSWGRTLNTKWWLPNATTLLWFSVKNVICHEQQPGQEEETKDVEFLCLVYKNVGTWNTCWNGNAELSHLLPFSPDISWRERSPHVPRGVWTGMECCWTPSLLSRAKGKDMGYSTCCRQVYLNLLCRTAEWVVLGDVTSGNAHLRGARQCPVSTGKRASI